mgnify:CR=1 FL=1
MWEICKDLQDEIVTMRRDLHQIPEIGGDLPETKAYVIKKLTEMGIPFTENKSDSGLMAEIRGGKPGKTIALRADMDALPIPEDSGEEFSSEVPGKMHGCGHDMHTAMLLGAAKLLKAHEDELEGTVKLEFQPAEEIFQGSPDMIAGGLLEDPHVDAAVMFHVLAGMPLPVGTVLVPGGGITMASCEQYHIVVKGKGGHGSTPENCIDPITAGVHVHLALQELISREVPAAKEVALTVGKFAGGLAANVIPDTCVLEGTLRGFDVELMAHLKTRIAEVVNGVAATYRTPATIETLSDVPPLVLDSDMTQASLGYVGAVLPKAAFLPLFHAMASEDFALISSEIPSAYFTVGAAVTDTDEHFAQHHPKARFNDAELPLGAAAYAAVALGYIADHR